MASFHKLAFAFLAGTALATAAQAEDTATLAPAPTDASQIWYDPALPGTPTAAAIAEHGYVREEYFLTGTGNVYGYGADGTVQVDQADVPYTTRVLVVRPGDAARHSGRVYLNPGHPFYSMGVWDQLAEFSMERGDTYINVMTGADAAQRSGSRSPRSDAPAAPPANPTAAHAVLAWFNAERYAPIEWPEDGLRWDVYADTARLARTGAFTDGRPVERVYGIGGSFTGSFLRTYVNSGFHTRNRTDDGARLFDGYLITVSSPDFISGYLPINGTTPVIPPEDPRRKLAAIDVPVIELLSESEALQNGPDQVPDKDEAPGAHRLYEMTGITHSGGDGGMSEVLTRQLAARGATRMGLPADACPYPLTDIRISDYVHSSLANLDRWVTEGVAPGRAPRMERDGEWAAKDPNNNSRGGLQAVQIEVPLAYYGEAPAESECDKIRMFAPMRRVPFSAERLKTLYPGGMAEYLEQFDAAVDRRVSERWLLPADAARIKAEARNAAEAAFG